ncbi:MAG TPA: hypothetical protein PK006_03285 [Saprospiraceae bacterium]|nr:hypothetical protein [Saprospiraceae bacterium]
MKINCSVFFLLLIYFTVVSAETVNAQGLELVRVLSGAKYSIPVQKNSKFYLVKFDFIKPARVVESEVIEGNFLKQESDSIQLNHAIRIQAKDTCCTSKTKSYNYYNQPIQISTQSFDLIKFRTKENRNVRKVGRIFLITGALTGMIYPIFSDRFQVPLWISSASMLGSGFILVSIKDRHKEYKISNCGGLSPDYFIVLKK